jgi:hypothetical protein
VIFHLIHRPEICPAQSQFRIVQQETGREVAWINRFLDRECVRWLAETTLRSYALDLLHFLRWWVGVHHTDAIAQVALTESTLLDYVTIQSGQQPRPAAASINRRIVVAERALRNEFPDAPLSVRTRLSPDPLAARSDGNRAAATGIEPIARKDAKT